MRRMCEKGVLGGCVRRVRCEESVWRGCGEGV